MAAKTQGVRIAPVNGPWLRRILQGAFETAAFLGNLAADLREARRTIELIPDVAYGSHPVAHRLDIYRPLFAPRPLPVLLYIHGGAFMLCSKETHRGLAIAKAAGAAYLVFNINYRLAPRHPFPAAIEDACQAYRWVVRNAARYGGDPERIVVAGESAGGNLALGVGIAAAYRRPEPYARAVFDLGVAPVGLMPVMPYLQVSNPQRRAHAGRIALGVARDIAAAYLRDAGPGTQDTLMADPIRVLEECGRPRRPLPPVYSAAGTADLCRSDVRRLRLACRRLGVPVTVGYYPGEMHAFHALRWRPAARRFWHETSRFMRLAAAPRVKPERWAFLASLRRSFTAVTAVSWSTGR